MSLKTLCPSGGGTPLSLGGAAHSDVPLECAVWKGEKRDCAVENPDRHGLAWLSNVNTSSESCGWRTPLIRCEEKGTLPNL